jgi:hypothetical protein
MSDLMQQLFPGLGTAEADAKFAAATAHVQACLQCRTAAEHKLGPCLYGAKLAGDALAFAMRGSAKTDAAVTPLASGPSVSAR